MQGSASYRYFYSFCKHFLIELEFENWSAENMTLLFTFVQTLLRKMMVTIENFMFECTYPESFFRFLVFDVLRPRLHDRAVFCCCHFSVCRQCIGTLQCGTFLSTTTAVCFFVISVSPSSFLMGRFGSVR